MATKNDTKTMPMLIGAIALGLLAALCSVFYLKVREAALEEKYAQDKVGSVQVIVANKDLRKGTQVGSQHFALLQVPTNFVHDDAVLPGEFNRYQGRSLTANLGSGKTLLKSFMEDDFPIDFSDIIPKGHRAMTITVDDVNSIGGHLRPGNHIDLFVNIPFKLDTKQVAAALGAGFDVELPPQITDMIPAELLAQINTPEVLEQLLSGASPSDLVLPVVQNIRVLATGKDTYEETLDRLRQPQRHREAHFSTITIDVDVEQAALLTVAIDKGELLALLRNRGDESASDFSYVAPRDLFSNAFDMAAEERERASRTTQVAGVDVNGNLVDDSGKTLVSREQLAAAGYSINENGQIIDKDGNIVDPADIVVAADGRIMTKQQLAAAGLTVNASGQIIDSNGNVISADDVIIAADGAVMTKQQLAATGLSVNENGEIVDKDGRVVSADDLVFSSEGRVLSKQQLAAAGYTVNEKGEIVDKDGNVIDPKDIIIAADGTVLSKEQLAAAGLSINENGEIVDKDGNVISADDIVVASDGSIMTKEELAAAGLSINENGEIVDKNGNAVDPDDLFTSADGTVLSKKALASRGLSVNEKGEIVDAEGNVLSAEEIAEIAKDMVILGTTGTGNKFQMIIGGSSQDGVAKSQSIGIKNDTDTEEEE